MRIRATIIGKITDLVEAVPSVKAVYPYPEEKLETYPCAVFFEDSFDNNTETNEENLQSLKYLMYVVVGTTEKDKSTAFKTILPNAVDDIISEINENWDAGLIDGQIVQLMVSGGKVYHRPFQGGLEAIQEINITVKLLTNNS